MPRLSARRSTNSPRVSSSRLCTSYRRSGPAPESERSEPLLAEPVSAARPASLARLPRRLDARGRRGLRLAAPAARVAGRPAAPVLRAAGRGGQHLAGPRGHARLCLPPPEPLVGRAPDEADLRDGHRL